MNDSFNVSIPYLQIVSILTTTIFKMKQHVFKSLVKTHSLPKFYFISLIQRGT